MVTVTSPSEADQKQCADFWSFHCSNFCYDPKISSFLQALSIYGVFHQSKGLFHHLARFSFHCPLCSTWYCIWYSLRWTFTEWGQGGVFAALFLLLNCSWMTLGSPVCGRTPYWNFFMLSPDFRLSCVKIVQVSHYPNPQILPVSAFSFVVFIHQGLWNGRCQKVLQLLFVVESCRSQMCSPAPLLQALREQVSGCKGRTKPGWSTRFPSLRSARVLPWNS